MCCQYGGLTHYSRHSEKSPAKYLTSGMRLGLEEKIFKPYMNPQTHRLQGNFLLPLYQHITYFIQF